MKMKDLRKGMEEADRIGAGKATPVYIGMGLDGHGYYAIGDKVVRTPGKYSIPADSIGETHSFLYQGMIMESEANARTGMVQKVVFENELGNGFNMNLLDGNRVEITPKNMRTS
ncbi:MAG: hypothetical protein NTU57_02145 [Candidatus Aenigmarchaeota archaeon]|nr:hypothetical protein [Candidatus Aenigmarchaeota archaeon]